MTPSPDYEGMLDRVAQNRRDFVKKVIAGTVFASPLMASFSLDGLSMDVAEALPSNQFCSNMTELPGTLYLDRDSGGALFLNLTPPDSTTAKFSDSPALSKSHGNPWTAIGTWETSLSGYFGLAGFPELTVWLGLKNSDDQGTQFDLKAELTADPPSGGTTLVYSGETECITGVTRNPAKAKQVTVTLDTVGTPAASATPPTNLHLSLTISARIASDCAGHGSAIGLRLYYDAAERDSALDLSFCS